MADKEYIIVKDLENPDADDGFMLGYTATLSEFREYFRELALGDGWSANDANEVLTWSLDDIASMWGVDIKEYEHTDSELNNMRRRNVWLVENDDRDEALRNRLKADTNQCAKNTKVSKTISSCGARAER